MTDYILKHRRDIDASHLGNMHKDDDGASKLEINLYYAKDHRPRGLKLSVYRCVQTPFGTSYDIMNRYNGLIHLADLPRKPTAKVAAAWEARVCDQLDAIAEIALASAAPDWPQVKALFQTVDA